MHSSGDEPGVGRLSLSAIRRNFVRMRPGSALTLAVDFLESKGLSSAAAHKGTGTVFGIPVASTPPGHKTHFGLR
jgi:hypothetical protein